MGDHSYINSVPSIILDGEMLVWDPVAERLLPFGTLKTAALGESVLFTVMLKLIVNRQEQEGA